MPRRPATLLQGTLDLLILKALSTGELHGLGVSLTRSGRRQLGLETAEWARISFAIARALEA